VWSYNRGERMKEKLPFILIMLTAGVCAQADGLDDRLLACSKIVDDPERLACFDSLVDGNDAVESPAPAASQPEAEVVAVPAATDDLGAETLRNRERVEEEINVTATVTSCSERSDGRYVFHFDNGQVWRQSKNERLHFRDCNFNVTITKDFFGYKMQRDGEKRRIRIKRVK